MLQTRPLKPIPVFRPGRGVNTVITFMLELKPETTSSKPFRIRSLLFLSDSFRIETIDKYVHTLRLFPRKPYPIPDQNGAKTLNFGAAHTYMAYIREYSPRAQSGGVL